MAEDGDQTSDLIQTKKYGKCIGRSAIADKLLKDEQYKELRNFVKERITEAGDLSQEFLRTLVDDVMAVIANDFGHKQYKRTTAYAFINRVLKTMSVDVCSNQALIDSINKKTTIRRIDKIYELAINSGKLSDALAALKFRAELTNIKPVGDDGTKTVGRKKNSGKKAPTVQVGNGVVFVGNTGSSEAALKSLPLEVLESMVDGENKKQPARIVEVGDVQRIVDGNG